VNLSRRNFYMLAALVLGVIGVIVDRSSDATPQVVSVTDSPAMLENRLAKLRQTASTVPAKAEVLKGVDAVLKSREKGVMVFNTAPQAQAHLMEVIRRIAIGNKIDARGGDFTPPALLGADYGQVAVSVTFESTIDAFVNFLADLSKETELIAPSEVHISIGNAKNKTVNVRMTLAGVVPRKLVPEKKNVMAL
jgi:uncharacterized protein YfcZ (UPF0381/DUF406 family)